MDFDRLRALVWTIDEGTVTAAAQRLHRTQPAVTRLLQTLEDGVGTVLIDRAARPLAPTPAGRRVVQIARDILQMADALRLPSTTEAGSRMTIRLGISRALMWHFAQRAFASPPAHLRALDYRVRSGWSSQMYRAFCEKQVDCALVLMPLDWAPRIECVTALVRKEPLLIIAPKAAARRVQTLADAADEPWILNPDGCGFREFLAREMSKARRRLHVRYEIDAAPQEHISLVAAGLGWSVVPASTLRHHPLASGVARPRLGLALELGVWLLANHELATIEGLQTHVMRVFGGASSPAAPPSSAPTTAAPTGGVSRLPAACPAQPARD